MPRKKTVTIPGQFVACVDPDKHGGMRAVFVQRGYGKTAEEATESLCRRLGELFGCQAEIGPDEMIDD